MNQVNVDFDYITGSVKPLHGVCCAPYIIGDGSNQRVIHDIMITPNKHLEEDFSCTIYEEAVLSFNLPRETAALVKFD